MPFEERSQNQQRQQMVHQVRDEGMAVSQAARTFGVRRKTVYCLLLAAAGPGVT